MSISQLPTSASLELFVTGARQALGQLFNDEPVMGELTTRPGELPSECEVSVSVGFVGDLQGQLMLGMPRRVALEMAGTLLMSPIAEFDDLAQSGMAEIGNIVAGTCATVLGAEGLTLNITLPSVIEGEHVKVRFPQLTVYESSARMAVGPLVIAIGLK